MQLCIRSDKAAPCGSAIGLFAAAARGIAAGDGVLSAEAAGVCVFFSDSP